jgi:hypothetical protein
MADTEVKKNDLELFSYKEITFISLIFIGVWIGVNLLFKLISSFFNRSVGRYWPIGKVEPIIPTIFGIIIVAIVFISFLLILEVRSKYEFNLYIVIIIGILLIIGTNIFHGLWKGFVSPTEGSGGLTYYWDAIEIEDPLEFLRTFNQRQDKLELHSRTHPPGAVLLYYFLYKIFIFSALISLAILIISTIFSALFLYGILKREINNELSLYTTFLFLLIPAIQIYYLANNYAIITALILGVIYFYMHPDNRINLIGTICCLFLIAFLTFMVVFILGVLFCFETIKSYKNKRVTNFKNIFLISMSLFLIYVVFLVLFNFNYIASFLYASQQENPQGFWLFADPFGYFVSRVENILEILFFFGPFLFLLFLRGNSILKGEFSDYYLLMISAIVVLLSLFLLGVYKTGETARACSYIYPFLLFPVAFYLNERDFPLSEKNKLLILVFIQTIILQLIGFYKW